MGVGRLIYRILLFSSPPSGRGPNMTGILLTGTSSFNSISQLKVISIALDKTEKNWDFHI